MTITQSGWTCTALVPNAKTNKRAACGASDNHGSTCASCGAPRRHQTITTTTNKTKNKETTMSTVKPASNAPHAAAKPHTNATPTPAVKPVTAAPAPAPVQASDAKPAGKPDPNDPASYKGLPRLKFYSTKTDCTDYCARVLPIFVDKYGAPKDPWGGTMVLREGQSPLKKVAKLEKKENEKKLLEAMGEEEKVAYMKAKRERRAAEKTAKKTAQRDTMMAELRKELESTGMIIKAPTQQS